MIKISRYSLIFSRQSSSSVVSQWITYVIDDVLDFPTRNINFRTVLCSGDKKKWDVRSHEGVIAPSLFFFYFLQQIVPDVINGPFLKGDNVMQIRGEWGRPYILLTNYFWCIYWDTADNCESPSHIRIYQHLWDPYSSSPVIHPALSTLDPVCFPSVWPIVTESNCRQKTTSNDYFIWESERETEKSQTGTFNKRRRPFFCSQHTISDNKEYYWLGWD